MLVGCVGDGSEVLPSSGSVMVMEFGLVFSGSATVPPIK